MPSKEKDEDFVRDFAMYIPRSDDKLLPSDVNDSWSKLGPLLSAAKDTKYAAEWTIA